LDAHVWRLIYKWARLSHPNKPTRSVTSQYFGKYNPARRDSWVFGSQKSDFYLPKDLSIFE
jgi:RNA-directed DNA polymerase